MKKKSSRALNHFMKGAGVGGSEYEGNTKGLVLVQVQELWNHDVWYVQYMYKYDKFSYCTSGFSY